MRNAKRAFEIVEELQKTIAEERRRNQLEVQKLKEECEKNYAFGRSVAESEWTKELEAVTRRHMDYTVEQSKIERALEKERKEVLLDAHELRMKNNEDEKERRLWKTKCWEDEERIKRLSIAVGKTALAETAVATIDVAFDTISAAKTAVEAKSMAKAAANPFAISAANAVGD